MLTSRLGSIVVAISLLWTSAVSQAQPEAGACCFAVGVCLGGGAQAVCKSVGGRFLGAGLTCAGDPDQDGVSGCADLCPLDSEKVAPGLCGCGVSDLADEDGDGVVDCVDQCPDTPPLVSVTEKGCFAAGACCFFNGACFELVVDADCSLVGGAYQGDESTCNNECRLGDANNNGRIESRDFLDLLLCFSGPKVQKSGACLVFDLNGDSRVDLRDLAFFEQRFDSCLPEPDNDQDGLADGCDNCPLTFNPQQNDTDRDGRGDACGECDSDNDCNAPDACTDPACNDDSTCATESFCADDGMFCNGEESCDETTGECVSSGDPCESNQTCIETTDKCANNCFSSAECDDYNSCTLDTCVYGVCLSTAVNCDDSDACTTDTCDTATGCINTVRACPFGHLCNETTGECECAIPDCDGDGVVNEKDNCPNTPTGVIVDENGCAASQRDSDNDGVPDNIDQCPNTLPTANVDPTGCPVTNPGDPDADNDGVGDNADQCPDTAPHAQVDPNGCTATQRDTDNDGVNDANDNCPGTAEGAQVDADGCSNSQRDDDSDGVPNGTDRCPGTPAGSTVGADGCIPGGGGGGTPVCGNGIREGNEQCEPPNTVTCSDTCTVINTGNTTINANNCASRVTISGEGVFAFDNDGATTDGPAHTECTFSRQDQTALDVWALWTSPCTGTVFVSTCNLTGLDTKLVVYSGSTCPTATSDPVTCNDDGCGNNSVQSLVSFEAIQGQSFLVRLGVYPAPNSTPLGGTGWISITCGLDACPSGGACTASGTGAGCSDEACCERVCTVDPFCCSTRWDATCVWEAQGLCGSGFTTCGVGAGSCTHVYGNGSPGCNDVDCCNDVCRVDPYCCLTEWDDLCATREATICRSSCGTGAGACDAVHNTPGCSNEACCAEVCPRDPFCCQTEWDQGCVDLANEHCPL